MWLDGYDLHVRLMTKNKKDHVLLNYHIHMV